MRLFEKDITITRRRCVTPAHVIFEDTGKTRAVETVNAQGQKFVEDVPVKKKKFIEAVYEDQPEKSRRFCVEDGGETHEFANESQRSEFMKWKGRGQ